MNVARFREMADGYNSKIKREYDLHISLQNAHRKQAFFSLLPHAEKGFTFSAFARNFWPLPGDEVKEEEKIILTPESYEEAKAEMRLRIQKSKRLKKKEKDARVRPYTKNQHRQHRNGAE